jgi:hypothetical protein
MAPIKWTIRSMIGAMGSLPGRSAAKGRYPRPFTTEPVSDYPMENFALQSRGGNGFSPSSRTRSLRWIVYEAARFASASLAALKSTLRE